MVKKTKVNVFKKDKIILIVCIICFCLFPVFIFGIYSIASNKEKPKKYDPLNDTAEVIRNSNFEGFNSNEEDSRSYIILFTHYLDNSFAKEWKFYNKLFIENEIVITNSTDVIISTIEVEYISMVDNNVVADNKFKEEFQIIYDFLYDFNNSDIDRIYLDKQFLNLKEYIKDLKINWIKEKE
ncbi:hypothetical protein SCORR_v1c10340 (plasmid) [Spiroplasma corruscae]|uniref:Uncharacterized protein n=1 Tax=Spiroplasma corruscae TaxID=216934 RepID=A0A222EQV9_9MOLU|nr:hypothetical protein [Spiroplasma corruscae]ASP28806.1 hypothetical protein SCORR_v1c10340 [Spiroplasma corruscae]